jgi:hypothetical protein
MRPATPILGKLTVRVGTVADNRADPGGHDPTDMLASTRPVGLYA